MSDQALLSDLCSIWYVSGAWRADPACLASTVASRLDLLMSADANARSNVAKSKYRCPGCSARTCSLPCYKRHQQWAQCTGKRDPTKYVKRSQLATPAGIDHDFNFLSGIERDLDRAEKAVDEKLQSQATPTQPQQTQSLDRQLAAVGIHVIRAPKGLSRQRENKTHRSKSGYVKWSTLALTKADR
jgi:hypothetical protein